MNELADVIQQKTIKKVFDQRSDFIVIGLIGAIGTDISSAVNKLPPAKSSLMSRKSLAFVTTETSRTKHSSPNLSRFLFICLLLF